MRRRTGHSWRASRMSTDYWGGVRTARAFAGGRKLHDITFEAPLRDDVTRIQHEPGRNPDTGGALGPSREAGMAPEHGVPSGRGQSIDKDTIIDDVPHAASATRSEHP